MYIPKTVILRFAAIILLFIIEAVLFGGNVKTGLDNAGNYPELFKGKRIGIIANHTSYNSEGKFIYEVLSEMEGATVTAVFGPEHGFDGTAAAGEKIDGKTAAFANVPVYSLYGKVRQPTAEMFENVDVLVFDIQDIGARFYTYIYTMALSMDSAALNDKKFVVLDRPNPINASDVQGNILDTKFASFVGLYPIAVRHAMTAGELAVMFNEEGYLACGKKAALSVVPMTGYSRDMWYDQTGLKFIKPSPNMTSIDCAALYPGLCLIEGTNISEARGTDSPFMMFGAPWINGQELADKLNSLGLPAMRLAAAEFTPKSSKFKDAQCFGCKITITNRDALKPFESGILIIDTIHRQYPQHFKWEPIFDKLCGTDTIRKAITNGESLPVLFEKWDKDVEKFKLTRAKYLIYSN